jgi:hypothetical protein
MTSDMDVILAIQKLTEDTDTSVSFHHVKGHVDRQRRHEPTRIELENIACDDSAEECIKLNLTPLPFEPPPDARCMVTVRGMWIGGDIDRAQYRPFRQRSSSEHISRSAWRYLEKLLIRLILV